MWCPWDALCGMHYDTTHLLSPTLAQSCSRSSRTISRCIPDADRPLSTCSEMRCGRYIRSRFAQTAPPHASGSPIVLVYLSADRSDRPSHNVTVSGLSAAGSTRAGRRGPTSSFNFPITTDCSHFPLMNSSYALYILDYVWNQFF
jgi:hypothetical protein